MVGDMRKKIKHKYLEKLLKATAIAVALELGPFAAAAGANVPSEPVTAFPVEAPARPVGWHFTDEAFLGGVLVKAPGVREVETQVYRFGANWDIYTPASPAPGIDTMSTASIIPGVFASVAIPMRHFPVSARWSPVFAAIRACQAGCGRISPAFRSMVAQARDKRFVEKLSWINNGVNRMIAYASDSQTYGSADYWAKPDEILLRGVGDCEDFAILKMAALVDAGVPAEAMSLVVLEDKRLRVFHAVLTVSTGSGTFVLDNLRNMVVRDTQLPDYLPLYSFSGDRAWIHGSKVNGAQVAQIKGGFKSIAPGEGLPSLD
jgi:predicted transglutaminase-like cysteine proteinase